MTTFQPGIHYSKIVEGYILGVCLIEPAAFLRVKHLTVDMFYFEHHRLIFQALTDMDQQAIPIDLITVTDYIERTRRIPYIEDHQTAWFLCRLTNDVIHSAHLQRWCVIIKTMWQMRELDRINPKDIKQATQTVQRINAAPSKGLSLKTYRFLLERAHKSLIRPHLLKYGSRIIVGQTEHKIRVSSPLLVFLMAICEPEYTWTCGQMFDEELTNAQCKARLPENATLSAERVWIDNLLQFPVAWR